MVTNTIYDSMEKGVKDGRIHTPPFRRLGWLMQLAAWGILLSMPVFFTFHSSENVTMANYTRFLVGFTPFIIIFYINYFYLVERFIYRKQFVWFFLSNIVLIAGMMFLVHLYMNSIPPPDDRVHDREIAHRIRFFIGQSIMYLLVAGLSVAIKMTSSWYQVEATQRELEKSRSEAELQNLKSQLNPHFLFNTLNNIYSLIAISPDQAQQSVHDLSRLLRYVLYESSQKWVMLEKEINFLINYVELMRIRLPEHVEIDIDIATSVKQETPIAPLLFISLLENAFKHGVSNHKPSSIRMQLYPEGNELVCQIENTSFPKDNDHDRSGSGIGLANLQKRLELLYPGRYAFHCGADGNKYKSELRIMF